MGLSNRKANTSTGSTDAEIIHTVKNVAEDIQHNYILTIALDFGTTFSGYAYSFERSKIYMNKNWGENLGCTGYKTPTCVLTGPANEFVAFGYEAEERFGLLVEEEDQQKYNMYRHFKMLLHKNPNLSLDSTLTSESGHQRAAIDIFVMAIKYLKDHALQRISDTVESMPDKSMIRWILTVPAIWTDSAKQFMREAAFQAGCVTKECLDQLIIALEPEAASFFCRKASDHDVSLDAGTKYLVIDAGGGTVDITAHEIIETGGIKELFVANGGPWGGMEVNKRFIALLSDLFGSEFINTLREKSPYQFLNLITLFEKAKKQVTNGDERKTITINLPWAIAQTFLENTGKNIEKSVNERAINGVCIKGGILVIDHHTSVGMFTDVIQNITQHVSQLFENPCLHGLSHVMLVGGFGQSQILQQSLKDIMPPDVILIIPEEAQLAVIKGAIHYAYDHGEIKSRIARMTYGTDVMRPFNQCIHEEKRKFPGANIEWCDGIFEPFIKKGEPVDVGKVVEKNRTPVIDKQTEMVLNIYKTEKEDLDIVEYVDRPYINKIGEIVIKMPDVENNFDRKVQVKFIFGGTEIKVKVFNTSTDVEDELMIDFLTGGSLQEDKGEESIVLQ